MITAQKPKQVRARNDAGGRIRILRQRCGLSVRELALRSDMSPAMISYAERGVNSMSLVTLEKVLGALGTSFGEFFGEKSSSDAGPFFSRERMPVVSDVDRTYTLLLSRGSGVPVEMSDERIRPSREKPSFARLKNDIGGYVLSGDLTLEVRGEGERTLRPGDAFYVTKSTAHRGFAAKGEEVHLITVAYFPPK